VTPIELFVFFCLQAFVAGAILGLVAARLENDDDDDHGGGKLQPVYVTNR